LETRGHRFHAPDAFTATTWEQLESGLGERKVMLSSAQRREVIVKRVAELAAEALRATQQALGEIVGSTTTDELLGEIFAAFCIGK
jgi:tRNA U34 5-carboxymethylaminomethyl modifying GTPase MnmE/TrmE